jgi:putative addiction module antidote
LRERYWVSTRYLFSSDGSIVDVRVPPSGPVAQSNGAAKIRVRKIGNSLGLILPKDVADQLRVGEDDTAHYAVDSNGLQLTPFDPDFDAAMEAFGQTRRKYRNTLRALAK